MSSEMTRAAEAFRWLKRRGGPIAAVVLLVAVGIFAHRIALVNAELIGTLSAKMAPVAAGRLNFVSYVNAHPLIVLPYVAAFMAGLAWMQFRQLPRWSLRVTYWCLALPVLGYMWICFRIVTARLPLM